MGRALLCLGLLGAGAALAQQPGPLARRFGLDVNPEAYPQGEPKEALRSVIKAINNERIDYLMAHLADPAFVDGKVKEYKTFFQGGTAEARELLAFQRLVAETAGHFARDPVAVKELRRFAEAADFEVMEGKAAGVLKAVAGRKVYLKQVGGRWFMEDRQQ